MNVPSSEDLLLEGMKSFSDDVLKIELSGPDYEHFSVVDLPGLFRSTLLHRSRSNMPVLMCRTHAWSYNERRHDGGETDGPEICRQREMYHPVGPTSMR